MKFNWNGVSKWLKDKALYFHPFSSKLGVLETSLYSVLKIILILILLYYILTIFHWTFEKENNLYIEPFRTNGVSQDIDGSAMAILLQNQMQNIRDISKFCGRKSPELSTPPMRVVSLSGYDTKYNVMNLLIPINLTPIEEISIAGDQDDLEASLSQIGSINIEGTSFSIGQVIMSMKELSGNRPEPISCSIQKFGSVMHIVGSYQDAQNAKEIFSWEVRNNSLEQNNAINDPIVSLIEDLAFQITYSLGKSRSKINETYPQSWLTFKRLLQSREAYNTYLTNGNVEYLNQSMKLLSSAYLLEPHYNGSLRKSMLYDLGLAFLSEKEYNKSRELFEKLSVLEPETGYFCLALAYYGDNDFKTALNFTNKAIVLNPEEKDPEKNANAWLIKGLIFLSKWDYANASKSLDNATDNNRNLEWAWFLKGIISFEQVMDEKKLKTLDSINMKDALFKFYKTKKINPNNSWALFSIGRILRDEDSQWALELFNKAIELDPSNAFAWNERGNCLMDLKRYEEALEANDIALEISPDKWNFWNDRELLLDKMNKDEEADKCSERANELGRLL